MTSVLTHHKAVGTAGELTQNKLRILELIKTNESDLEGKKSTKLLFTCLIQLSSAQLDNLIDSKKIKTIFPNAVSSLFKEAINRLITGLFAVVIFLCRHMLADLAVEQVAQHLT